MLTQEIYIHDPLTRVGKTGIISTQKREYYKFYNVSFFTPSYTRATHNTLIIVVCSNVSVLAQGPHKRSVNIFSIDVPTNPVGRSKWPAAITRLKALGLV